MEATVSNAHQFVSELSIFVFACSALAVTCLASLRARGQKFISTSHALVFLVAVIAIFAGLSVLFQSTRVLANLGLSIGVVLSLISSTGILSIYAGLLLVRPWEVLITEPALLLIPKFGAGIVLGSWLLESFRKKRFSLMMSDSLALFLCLFGWLIFANVMSGQAEANSNFVVEKFVPIIVLVFVMSQALRDREGVRLLEITFALSAIFIAINSALFTMHSVEWDSTSRLVNYGLLGNSNDIAAVCLPAIAFVLFMQIGRGYFRSVLRLGIFSLLSVAVFFTQSRGALFGLVFGLVVRQIAKKGMKLQTIVSFAALGFVFFTALSLLGRAEGDMEMSSNSRLNYAIAGVRMAIDHPIFGIGLNRYPELYERYTPAFYEWGERTAHSSWVLTLSESGPIGLGLLVLFFCSVVVRGYRVRSTFPELLPAMGMYLVAMSFLSHTYFFFPYLLAFLIVSASQKSASEVAVSTDEASEPERGTRPVSRPLHSSARSFSRVHSALAVLFSLGVVCFPYRAAAEIALLSNPDLSPEEFRVAKGESNLKLHAARGETVSFLARSVSETCETPRLHLPPGVTGEIFLMRTIETKKQSYPGARVGAHFDPLIPVGSKTFPCESTKSESYWIDLHVSNSTQAGKFRATFQVGNERETFGLEVWPMTMAAEPSIPFYSDFSTWYNLLGHFGKWSDGEGVLAQRYARFLLAHRILPISPFVSVPKIVQTDEAKSVLDFGTGSGNSQSFDAVNLSWRPGWGRIGVPTVSQDKVMKPYAGQYLRAVGNTHDMLSRSLADRFFFYLWDEPAKEDFSKLRHLAAMAKKLAPGVEVMVTTTYDASLHKLVDIFCPVMDFYEHKLFPGPDTYRDLQRKGKEVWWYVSCMSHGCCMTPNCDVASDSGTPDMTIERPRAHPRVIGWLSWKYSIDAFLYYFVNFAYQFYPDRDPWKDQWDFSGNGDGTLVYPLRSADGFSLDAPAASIRLKMLRRSSFDIQYLEWAKTLDLEGFDERFSGLVKTTRKWSRKYSDYEALRVWIGTRVAKVNSSR